MCLRRVSRALAGCAPVTSSVTVPLADPASVSFAITRCGPCERRCHCLCMTEDNAPPPFGRAPFPKPP